MSLLLQADPLPVAVALLVCLGIFTVPLTPLQRQRLLALAGPSRPGLGAGRPRLGDAPPDLEYLGV